MGPSRFAEEHYRPPDGTRGRSSPLRCSLLSTYKVCLDVRNGRKPVAHRFGCEGLFSEEGKICLSVHMEARLVAGRSKSKSCPDGRGDDALQPFARSDSRSVAEQASSPERRDYRANADTAKFACRLPPHSWLRLFLAFSLRTARACSSRFARVLAVHGAG